MVLRRWQSTPTGNIKNTDFAEDDAVSERREHLGPVVGNHRQPTAFDDVQLLADVALTTHVVAGAEHGQLQLEYQLHQQSRLAFLENGYSPQRFHVHADRDLRL